MKEIQNKIEEILKDHKKNALTEKDLLSALGLQSQDKKVLVDELRKMENDGRLIKTARGRYGLPERLNYLAGILQGNKRGFAFLRPDLKSEDVFISADNLKGAAHGDRVMVRLENRKRSKKRREGTVIGILKRGSNRLVGTLHRDKKNYYVIPDDRRFPGPIIVPFKKVKGPEVGDKVVVEIEKWGQGTKPSRGKIVEHFGPAGSQLTEKLAFSHKYELPGDFPPAVLKALDQLPGEDEVAEALSSEGREDLRDLSMVTIDDELARDFDDAVSLQELPGGSWRLGVHIADVSHYVREGKPIDREAFRRGTSIYLAERVIHMLPPALSENLCSLQANKNRLAVSVIMDIDDRGEMTGARFTPSLIKVTERLTYQQVEAHLKGQQEKPAFKDKSLKAMLDNMSTLAEVLRRRRMKRGALDLDLPEARIEVDEEGVPVTIEKRVMGRSESLIEEFMIYCNEAVAGYLIGKERPCIFRVHAVPAEEKLAQLRETLTLMGIGALSNIKILKPEHLIGLLEQTRGERTERLVRYLVLRSLPQAMYSAENEGHFGLASQYYCHFTSPIRRYPDLVVHRILKQQLSPQGLSGERAKRLQARLPEVALYSSERERAAVEAERADEEIKKAQYMEQKIGEVYSGIINGVTNFGLFVELDNTIEGMIPVGELDDDYYIYNEKAASLVGERKRKTYRLGDAIKVRVIRASREEGQVTFAPAE
ncbi:MAG: ribonuclease R [Bacillota bacterium]|nr:ribonuclease R [Bacillota bacterium]